MKGFDGFWDWERGVAVMGRLTVARGGERVKMSGKEGEDGIVRAQGGLGWDLCNE